MFNMCNAKKENKNKSLLGSKMSIINESIDEMKSLEEILKITGFKIDPKDLELFLNKNLPLVNNGNSDIKEL